jgi:hypothetical protein
MTAHASYDGHVLPYIKPGDLKLVSIIANGGFASVFKARHDGADVAIKAVTRDTTTADAEFALKSFIHECKVMSSLHHRCARRQHPCPEASGTCTPLRIVFSPSALVAPTINSVSDLPDACAAVERAYARSALARGHAVVDDYAFRLLRVLQARHAVPMHDMTSGCLASVRWSPSRQHPDATLRSHLRCHQI